MCDTYCFAQQQWLPDRASVLRSTYITSLAFLELSEILVYKTQHISMRTVIQTSVLLTILPRTVQVLSSCNTAGMWEQSECHWTGLQSNEVLRSVAKPSVFLSASVGCYIISSGDLRDLVKCSGAYYKRKFESVGRGLSQWYCTIYWLIMTIGLERRPATTKTTTNIFCQALHRTTWKENLQNLFEYGK
jgi:hypothetical protein